MKINSAVYIIVAIIALGGLFFVFKARNPQVAEQQVQTQETSSPSPSPQDKNVFEFTIKGKTITSGQSTISVKQDDVVTLKITSDEPEEFHLHGYDESVDLEANVPAELKFTANITGRFPFELELSKTELGALEVLPQ